MCIKCKTREKYIEQAYFIPCSSIVVIPPKLFEEHFEVTGPVPYFMVIVGYFIMINTMKLCCNPDEEFPPGKNLHGKLRHAKTVAKNLLSTQKLQLVESLFQKSLHTHSRLDFIQSLEHSICYALAVMKQSTEKHSDFETFKSSVYEEYEQEILNKVSMNVIEWEIERCNADHLKEQKEANDLWNKEYATRKKELLLKSVLNGF
jgi:hypothetical protein